MKAKVEEIEEQIDENRRQSRIKALLMLVAFIVLVSVITVFSFKTTKKLIANNDAATKISITSDRFVPATLVVKAGTTVIWENQSISPQKLGANPFPTHASLSGLYTKQPIAPHATYSYTFQKKGTWQYSNYNQPTVNGTVIVQ